MAAKSADAHLSASPAARNWRALVDTLERFASTLLLALLGLAAMVCIAFQLAALAQRYSLDYGEAPLLDQAMRMLQGANIYRADISTPPYTISNYPPIYVAALTPFLALFGPSYAPGRMISMLSTWLAAFFIGLILWRFTRNRTAAAAGGLMLIAIPYVVRWSAFLRIDMLALAFAMAALWVLTAEKLPAKRLTLGALLLVAAIGTRQSYALAAPLAAFVWLLFNTGWRKALVLAALVGAITGLLFLALNIATGSGFFFNIVTANVNEWTYARVQWNFENLWFFAPILICIAGFSLFLFWKRRRIWTLTAPFLLGALASALTIGKIGSNVNYFMELCAAGCLAAGTVIAWAMSSAKLRILALPILGLLALQTLWMIQFTVSEETVLLRERQSAGKDLLWLENIVLQSDGNVLADEHMGMLTLARKPLVMQPFEVTQLALAGVWNQQTLVDDIRAKKFSLILIHDFVRFPIHKERWTPEMLAAIQTAYGLKQKLGGTWVYVPRQLLANPTLAPTPERCDHAPWRLPSDALYGVRWGDGRELQFLGRGNPGKLPVRAVADGLLSRDLTWNNRVAIQHDDPLNPGAKIWTTYANMASGSGYDSFVSKAFPLGTANVPVKAGDIIGYQGLYSGNSLPMWLNVEFAVLADKPTATAPYSSALAPESYLGLTLKPAYDEPNSQKLKCAP